MRQDFLLSGFALVCFQHINLHSSTTGVQTPNISDFISPAGEGCMGSHVCQYRKGAAGAVCLLL